MEEGCTVCIQSTDGELYCFSLWIRLSVRYRDCDWPTDWPHQIPMDCNKPSKKCLYFQIRHVTVSTSEASVNPSVSIAESLMKWCSTIYFLQIFIFISERPILAERRYSAGIRHLCDSVWAVLLLEVSCFVALKKMKLFYSMQTIAVMSRSRHDVLHLA